MVALQNTFVVLLGLIVGSFLNVVIYRLPLEKSIVKPRSQCTNCGSQVAWYDNVPVLSYLLLRGRCRKCKTKISLRYPLVELLTALLFTAALVRFGFGTLLFVRDLPFLALLVAITFIDLDHRIIPDELNIAGAVIGLSTAYFVPGFGLIQALMGAALGFGLFYSMAFAYEKLKGKSGLGGGDIKLLGMLGTFVGFQGVVATILVSSILGSVIGLTYAYFNREKEMLQVAIPYGPFLVVGALYSYLIGDLLWLPFTIPT